MANLFNWVEIPVADIERAQTFYEALLDVELFRFALGTRQYAVFPSEDHHIHGALVENENCRPDGNGVLVYLNASGRLGLMESRIESLGGAIVQPKTPISDEAGETVVFADSEGNRVGLHSPLRRQLLGPVLDAAMQALLRQQEVRFAFLLKKGPHYDDPATAPMQWEHARNMFTGMRDGHLSHVSAFPGAEDVLGFGIATA